MRFWLDVVQCLEHHALYGKYLRVELVRSLLTPGSLGTLVGKRLHFISQASDCDETASGRQHSSSEVAERAGAVEARLDVGRTRRIKVQVLDSAP